MTTSKKISIYTNNCETYDENAIKNISEKILTKINVDVMFVNTPWKKY